MFEEEIGHTEDFGIHWVLVGFGWAPDGLHLEVNLVVELADNIVKCFCVLHNTIIEKEGIERHLTDVTVQSKSAGWERRGRLPTEAKNIRDLFALYMEEFHLRYN